MRFYAKIILSILLFSVQISVINCTRARSFAYEDTLLREVESMVKNNNSFKLALAIRESSNNYCAWHKGGALGKYQFMPRTLKGLGLGDFTLKQFIQTPSCFSPKLQEYALNLKINDDIRILSDFKGINYLEKYIGKEFLGTKITLAGILAAAHLGGVYGTIKFLDSSGKYNPSDSNKTTIGKYLVEFSKYNYNNNVLCELKKVKIEGISHSLKERYMSSLHLLTLS